MVIEPNRASPSCIPPQAPRSACYHVGVSDAARTERNRGAEWAGVRRERFRELVERVDPVTALMTIAVVAAITLIAIETPIGVAEYGVPLLPGFVFAILHAGSLPLAVLRPNAAAVIGLVSPLVLQVLSADEPAAPWPWWPVLLVTQAVLTLLIALRGGWFLSVGSWLTVLVGSSVLGHLLRPDGGEATSINLVVFASVTGAALLAGVVLAQWSAIRAQLIRERQVSVEEHSARMLVEDRARIARELHDVIAHSLSIINVQATTAQYRHPGLDENAVGEFDDIAASSRQALREMRTLLGVLREDQGGPLAPQPTYSDIPDLVAQAQHAGMSVELRWPPSLQGDPPSDVVGLAAYRIVQEALSNAIRHAVGSSAVVEITSDRQVLHISVRNSPARRAVSSSAPGNGFGLVGMAERAAGVGGTVTAGETTGGGFLVRATLPLRVDDYRGEQVS